METLFRYILSLIAVYGLSFDITAEGLKPFNLQHPIFVVLLIFFLFEYKTEKDRRLFFCTLVPGILLGIFYTVGKGFQNCESLSWALSSRKTLIKAVCVIWGHSLLFTVFLRFLFRKLSSLRFEPNIPRKRTFWLVWVMLILCFLPWYLYCFPGNLTWDSGAHLANAIGQRSLSDHHPFFISLLLRGCIHLAAGSTQAGTALYSAFQLLMMTAVFAWCYVRICSKAKLSLGVRLLIFAAFALYPVHGVYSVTMWKDIPFAICVTAFLCVLDEIESSNKRNYVRLTALLILMTLTRHNGILISVMMIPVLLLRFPNLRKEFSFCGILSLGVILVWKCLLLPAMGVSGGNSNEKLSVPLQMIGRTMVEHRNELDHDFYERINAYFEGLEDWENYNPILADPIKDHFSSEKFDEDPLDFASIWMVLFRLYPREYIEAFLHNNYGYWYPETNNWIMYKGVATMRGDNFGVHGHPLTNWSAVRLYCNWLWNKEYLNLPVISLLFSPGFCFWVIVVCVFYCIWQRRSLLLHAPLLLLWLSIVFFAPVYCEFRYVYGLFTSLPLICFSSVLIKSKAS